MGDVVQDTARAAVGWSTGGLSELGSSNGVFSGGGDEAPARDYQSERMSLLKEGMQAGRDKAEQLTGQSSEQVGTDVADIVRRRREMLDQPSRAESMIRSQGQQQERRARMSGGSEAQQRQIALDSSRMAGVQGDADRERRLQEFQSLMSGIMSTQSALEPGYAQLYLSSQHIEPEEADPGFMGNLFDNLGL